MADLPELPKKLNKPVVIGVILAGGLLVYVWWSHRSSVDAATTDSADATIDPLTGLPYSAETGTDTGLNAATGSGDLGTSSPIGSDSGGIVDQAGWTADVVTKLGEVYNPDSIYQALGDYLAQSPLSSDEAAIVRAAWAASGKLAFLPQSYTLKTSGSTPGTPPPPPSTPPPPPHPTPTPTPHKYTKYVEVEKYTSSHPVWQSTLSGIASHVGVSVGKLQEINHLGSSTVIHPGQKIYYA